MAVNLRNKICQRNENKGQNGNGESCEKVQLVEVNYEFMLQLNVESESKVEPEEPPLPTELNPTLWHDCGMHLLCFWGSRKHLNVKRKRW